jgi:hypothetical protein
MLANAPDFVTLVCLMPINYLGRKKIPVVLVSYCEKIRVGRLGIFFLNIFFVFFPNNSSVTTDAILAAARNHPEKIGSHCQSR